MRTDIAAIVAERNKNYWPAKASSRESLLSEHRRSTPISATNRQLDLLLGLSIFRSIRLRVGASCSGRSPTMTTRQVETVIVGGGQAGLALSYYLKQEGREHVVLERRQPSQMRGAISAGIRSHWLHPTFRSEC